MNMMDANLHSGGLSHLVEAASALTKLVDSSPKQQQQQQPVQTMLQSHLLPSTALASTNSGHHQQQFAPSRSVVSDDESYSRKKNSHGKDVLKSPINTSTASNNNLRSSREIFPQRLMGILSDATLSDVISWLPHGQSFVIIRPDVFAERVLPKHLPSEKSSTKYPSFTRKLNRWGFRQATRGPDTGAFHHPLFRRDQPHLCLDMVCQKSRKRASAASLKKEELCVKDNLYTNNNEPLTPTVASTISTITANSLTSSLPPKKRKMLAAAQATEDCISVANAFKNNRCGSFVSNSGDERSVSSMGSSVSTAASTSPPKLPYLQNQIVGQAPTLPSTANANPSFDTTFVSATLKARAESEKLAAAKSMLFDAYMKVLNAQ